MAEQSAGKDRSEKRGSVELFFRYLLDYACPEVL